MARFAFFSFHYEKDIWRASIVRNSWVTKTNGTTAGFWDKAKWEEVKKKSDAAIRSWIREQMKGTTVTVVLVGSETYNRPWVNFEIEESYKRGNGILAIKICGIKTNEGYTCAQGKNPLSKWHVTDYNGKKTYFDQMYTTYHWVNDDGYTNIGKWIEKAAKDAGH